ncbi:MAG: apolipoprotein N-acyltransferase [Alphaproteobacteria bacterium]|nr:apolipoprotein N-acyltransferase [Alphaproteobacteria bacterium]
MRPGPLDRLRDRLDRAGARLTALGGWRRRGALVLAGAGATLALPPVGVWPALFPAFWVLLRVLDGADAHAGGGRRAAFGAGWWFAFGYFTVGWYWIANALLVFSDRLWWMVPFAAVGLPAAMAVYYGLAALGARTLAAGLPRALALAAAFAAADWLRGQLLTGFPWNVWGYAWAESAWLSQGAALVGVFGLGLLALVSAALAAAASYGGTARRALALLAAAALIPAAVAGYGAARLDGAPAMLEPADGPGLRVVQAGIPQREKWPRRYARRNFDRHLELSLVERPAWVETVIWPETAAAFFIEETAPARAAIAAVLPPDGLLLTGAPRRTADPPSLRNALVAIDPTGAVRATYDKHHLVPFGEYVPLKRFLPFQKVVEGATDYAPGPGPRTLTLDGLPPVSPLICYETIFPAGVVARDGPRPGWLLNLTNDAWYGRTAGPYQHLQHARLRAVEQGLPLVRAANTGISAAFDGWGREIARLPLGASGRFDMRLPPALAGPPPYARLGDAPFALLLAAVALAAGTAHRRCSKRDGMRPFVEGDS